jgi:hypothetical protein
LDFKFDLCDVFFTHPPAHPSNPTARPRHHTRRNHEPSGSAVSPMTPLGSTALKQAVQAVVDSRLLRTKAVGPSGRRRRAVRTSVRWPRRRTPRDSSARGTRCRRDQVPRTVGGRPSDRPTDSRTGRRGACATGRQERVRVTSERADPCDLP